MDKKCNDRDQMFVSIWILHWNVRQVGVPVPPYSVVLIGCCQEKYSGFMTILGKQKMGSK